MSAILVLIRAFTGLCLAGLVLCTVTIYYTLNAVGFGGIALHVGIKPSADAVYVNEVWFRKITAFFFGILACLLFVYELFLLCNPLKFGYRSTGVWRSVFYAFLGLSSMGLAADLGIASGIIMTFAGVVTFVLVLCVKCGAAKQDTADLASSKDSGFTPL
jgi:hypothetical protein